MKIYCTMPSYSVYSIVVVIFFSFHLLSRNEGGGVWVWVGLEVSGGSIHMGRSGTCGIISLQIIVMLLLIDLV